MNGRQKNLGKVSFSEAIREGGNRFDNVHSSYSCVEIGFYASQFERVYHLFSANQVLVSTQRELLKHHEIMLNRVYDFIGLDRV